ncbi:MAG: hypothetical protein ACIAS6_09330 [Phycisphaerales bacterium JB060]
MMFQGTISNNVGTPKAAALVATSLPRPRFDRLIEDREMLPRTSG